MSGAEIEYLPEPAVIAASAPEDLSAGEPASSDEVVRLRYPEALAVGFFLFELDVFGQPPRDRVGQLYYPDAFLFVVLAPFGAADCAHEHDERL